MAQTILHDILMAGVSAGASDWHIREGRPVGLRVDGKLVETDFVSQHEFIESAISQILPPLFLERFEREGDIDFAFQEDGLGRFRVNLHRQRGQLGMTMRYVKNKVPPYQELGLPETVLRIAENHQGIVFVTGATGCGKSTTLAAMIEHINANFALHVVTIEDPIEYSFDDHHSIIEQREVGLDCASFESALEHVLRQDPDVIVIGEMRNRVTFETALAASETGHAVLTTLHTNNASQSILRVLDMYPHQEREAVRRTLATNLKAIICQQLVPKAGGKGVVPAVEILLNTPIVAKLIQENRLEKIPLAIDAGVDEGMISFNRSLLGLVNSGAITEPAALEASANPQQLQMNLSGIFLTTDAGALIGE
ncbi:MAG: PilT/PilU family type 4a pilus ATPase [Lentisphaeria bacterium]|jgi:twitching motility protein PilT